MLLVKLAQQEDASEIVSFKIDSIVKDSDWRRTAAYTLNDAAERNCGTLFRAIWLNTPGSEN